MFKKTIFLKNRISVRSKKNKRQHRIIIFAGVLSLLFYIGSRVTYKNKIFVGHSQEQIKAAKIMKTAISVIRDFYLKSGLKIDEITDPNHTGLIGTEFSDITTTLGHLQAKRTTTSLNFAALIVHLLDEAGVSTGDTVAIGCSASFPASMIASLAATKAMEIHPIVIISLGSSSYGANNPDFNLLDIYQLLTREKIFDAQLAAISLGGEKDVGENFESQIKQKLIQQIRASEIPFIYESNIYNSVNKRLSIYLGSPTNERISAFINCGGSQANMGSSGLVLKVKPGLNNEIVQLPPIDERGVIFEMAALGVPVIHLLYIKGLVLEYGLSWDPIPLPEPGDSEIYFSKSKSTIVFWLIAVIYFLVLFLLIIYGRNINNEALK